MCSRSRSVCSVCRVGRVDDDTDADDVDRDDAEGDLVRVYPPSAFLLLLFLSFLCGNPLKEDDSFVVHEGGVRASVTHQFVLRGILGQTVKRVTRSSSRDVRRTEHVRLLRLLSHSLQRRDFAAR